MNEIIPGSSPCEVYWVSCNSHFQACLLSGDAHARRPACLLSTLHYSTLLCSPVLSTRSPPMHPTPYHLINNIYCHSLLVIYFLVQIVFREVINLCYFSTSHYQKRLMKLRVPCCVSASAMDMLFLLPYGKIIS